ncbi:MAG: hypothetical protein IKR07_04975 [Oscillospiraceae bacterium]|nr:hypothetical protein [Oscillospiraceae bacterium]
MRSIIKKFIPFLLAAALFLTAGGCASILEGEYHAAQRYVDELPVREGSEVIVPSYTALKAAILSLVENGQGEGTVSFTGYSGDPGEDLPRACAELKSDNALCAYAVDYFSYDVSRIVSFYEARIFVNFRRTAEEIAGIRNIGAVSRLRDSLFAAMQNEDESLVVQAVGPELSTAEVQNMAQEFYYDAPLDCLQLPYVSLRVYPGTGIYRIYEIGINYGSDESSRAVLSEQLNDAALAICAEIREENEAVEGDRTALAELAAQRLAEHSALSSSASGYGLTAYGALVGSLASDEGLAMAYKAMCDLLGLDCIVIAGRMDKAPHVWNMVRPGEEEDARYFHVDVSRLQADSETGETRALRGESEMWGSYWWDIDLYPFYGETVSVFGPSPEVTDGNEETQPQDESPDSDGTDETGETDDTDSDTDPEQDAQQQAGDDETGT